MSLRDAIQSMDITETGTGGVIGLAGGYSAITMVPVPLFALVAGGYLTVTAQYGIAIGLMVVVFGVFWLYTGGHLMKALH